MRATALQPRSPAAVVVVVAALCAAFFAGFSTPARADIRIFVTPIHNEADLEIGRTLTRATETALKAAIPDAEIVTPAALDTAIEMNAVRDCVGSTGSDGTDSCLTELADAVDVDYIARPHLGRIGDDLVLTLSILDGRRAVVLAQGLRRVSARDPAELLDVVTGLAKEVARGADLRSTRRRPVPLAPIVVSAGGVVAVGLGALALGVRGGLAGDYERARLDRSQAQAFELIDQPFLWGGIGLVVVGGGVALSGASVAVWSIVSEAE